MDIDMKMPTTDGLHKSAIIYRDNSARFIYVCFHCGCTFYEINETLQHIESHFQLRNVLMEQFRKDDNDDQLSECFPTQSVDIKIEVLENKNYVDEDVNPMPTSDTSFIEDCQREVEVKHREDIDKEKHQIAPSSSVKVTSSGRRKQQRKPDERGYICPDRCHKCPTKCRYTKSLRSHFQTHHADDNLLDTCRCKECDCFYKNPFELRMHVLKVHRMAESLSCNACGVQFNCSQSKQFKEHLVMHNSERPDDTDLWKDIRDGISYPTDDVDDYSKYEEIDSFTEEQHRCEFCTLRFYLKSNLDVHTKTFHYGQRRLQCGQCDSVFTTPKYYFAHQLEHQRVGPTITERDDNVLLANLDACIDERIIYDEGDESNEPSSSSLTCSVCNASFKSQYDIRIHIRERHIYKMFAEPMEPRKEFICDLCGKKLKTKKALKNHSLIHTNTKSHECTICGRKFRQKADRKIHERQHSGEKPYMCHECGKVFISQGLLTAHRRVHEDTTYPCPICGKVFNLQSSYKRHIATHNDDRSFQCPICSKSFTTRIYLTKHMAIHSNKT